MEAKYCKRGHRLAGNRLKDGRCAKCRRKYSAKYMREYRKRQREKNE